MTQTKCFFLSAALLLVSGLLPISGADYEWKKTEHSVALTQGDTVIWQHNHKPEFGKPYFHPLATTQGTSLTANRPPDHVWHRAGWWSWKKINGLNYWEENGKTRRSQGRTDIQSTEIETHKNHTATVKMTIHYHPPEKEAILTEARTIEVSAPDKQGNYHLDWTLVFTAVTDVKIDRTPIQGQRGGKPYGGYAGLSIRASMDHKAWIFLDSEGRNTKGHGKSARWVTHMGMTKSKEEAATVIIDHPENPGTPTKWYLNKGMPYYSPAVIFEKGIDLKKGDTLKLRYRMLIQSKQTTPAGIEKEYTDFTGIKAVSVIPDIPTREIEIGTEKLKMRFQVESFAVRPGAPVRVTLTNTDDMPHNVLFTNGDNKVAMAVAQKAWAMGGNGPANGWIPNDQAILGSSGLVEPGENDVFKFYAPSKPGDYVYICSFPGHSYTMKGIMRVTNDDLPDNFIKEPATPFGNEHELVVGSTPVVHRFNMQTVHSPARLSTRAIAVGLPGGTHYIFDPDYGGVRLAWFGAFIDLAGERTNRGRGKNTLLGQVARVGERDFPLRVGDPKIKPEFKFRGYQRKGTKPPAFIYDINGTRFVQQVTFTDKKQIVYNFVSKSDKPVSFQVDKSQITDVSSSTGTWNEGTLSLTAKEARKFSVTLTLKGQS